MATPTPTPWYKKRQVLGLAAAVLVAGAIVAGVLGGRASKHAQSPAPEAEAIQIKSDAQPGNIKSVLDALNGATKAAAESAGTETIVSPASTTTVTPQAPASTTGTFNDLAPSATSGSSSSSSSSLLGSLIKEQDAATIDNAIKPVQDQTSASILQQQQAASKTMAALAVAAGGAFCYPKTADEFHQAVENSACTIVALNSGEYKFKKQITVNRPVIIIGNPIVMPYLDGDKNARLFHVVAGGILELRFLRLQQGIGEHIQRPGLPAIDLKLGTVALVDLGGRFSATGCLFETRRQTVASFIKELEDNFRAQRLTFGGFIAVMGGSVDIIGCSFIRFRPLGNPNFFEVNVGRDILMIAGTINVVGCFFFNMQLFHNKASAGGIYGVMGGNLNIAGWALTTITGLNAQWGTGLQTYVGGGNSIMTGVDRFTASICLGRGGFGLFSVSAGNLVVTGFAQMSGRGASADFGTANWSVGAGTLTSIGTALYSAHIARSAHIAGGYWFVGAGVITVVGQVRNNMGTSTNQMGIGFHVCNVAGVTQAIGMTSYTTAMARSQFGAGTEAFMSAGFITYVRVMRYRNIGAGVFIGKGNQIYVNRGAGVFIGNRQAARILIDWRTTRNVYTIAGQGTGRAGANTNLYIDASGRYPLGESTFNFPPPGSAFNKTKYAEWKAGKRKLVHASHLPLFRKLQEQEATEKNNADLLFPRSFLVAVDDKVYEGTLVVPDAMDIEMARNDEDHVPGMAFFRAVENLAGPVDTSRNLLQIYTNNTDCLACDVPADQLVGDTPCVPSDQCAGKTLFDVLNLDETPQGLKDFAGSVGWTELDAQAGVDLTQPGPEPILQHFTPEPAEAEVPVDPALRALQAAGGADGPAKLPDVGVIEGELTVYCKRDAAAPAAPAGESACGGSYGNVRVALAYALGDLTGEAHDFSVSAWDKQLSIKAPEFSEYFDLGPLLASLEPAALEGHADAQASRFGFTVTTKDEAQRDVLAKKLTALADDPAAVLEKVAWLDESGTEYVGATLTKKNVLIVPAVPLGAKTSDLFSGSLAPAVVVKEEHSFGGLHTGTPGETYEVAVANFPAGNTVEVKILDAETGEAVANQSATAIPIKLAKAAGVSSVDWTLPEDLEPEKLYVLEASLANAPAVAAQTLPFKVVAA